MSRLVYDPVAMTWSLQYAAYNIQDDVLRPCNASDVSSQSRGDATEQFQCKVASDYTDVLYDTVVQDEYSAVFRAIRDSCPRTSASPALKWLVRPHRTKYCTLEE